MARNNLGRLSEAVETPAPIDLPIPIKIGVALFGSIWGAIPLVIQALVLAVLLELFVGALIDFSNHREGALDHLFRTITQKIVLAAVVWIAYIAQNLATSSQILNPDLPLPHVGAAAALAYFGHSALKLMNYGQDVGLVDFSPLRLVIQRFLPTMPEQPKDRQS